MYAQGGRAHGAQLAVESSAGARAVAGSATGSRWAHSGANAHSGVRTELEYLVAEEEEFYNGDVCSWDAVGGKSGAPQFGQPRQQQQQHPVMPFLQATTPRSIDIGPTMPVCEDWPLIHEVMFLAEQKEAEVFATLLECRERRLAALRENCQQAQGEIKKLMRVGVDASLKDAPEGNARSATEFALHGATKGRGLLTSCRPHAQVEYASSEDALCCQAYLREDGHVLHPLEEVSFFAIPSSPSTARLETASGSASFETHTQTTTPYWLTPRPPHVVHEQVEQEARQTVVSVTGEVAAADEVSPTAANALRCLREKDELLSIGINWLEGELEDAKLQVQRVKNSARPCRTVAGGQELVSQRWRDTSCEAGDAEVAMPVESQWIAETHTVQAVTSRLPSPGDDGCAGDVLNAKVDEFFELPEHQNFRSLLRRVAPGVYLYGSTPIALRIGLSTGQLEVSCDTGRTWARLSDFVHCMDRVHDDLVQSTWALASIPRQ